MNRLRAHPERVGDPSPRDPSAPGQPDLAQQFLIDQSLQLAYCFQGRQRIGIQDRQQIPQLFTSRHPRIVPDTRARRADTASQHRRRDRALPPKTKRLLDEPVFELPTHTNPRRTTEADRSIVYENKTPPAGTRVRLAATVPDAESPFNKEFGIYSLKDPSFALHDGRFALGVTTIVYGFLVVQVIGGPVFDTRTSMKSWMGTRRTPPSTFGPLSSLT